ncbi:hypothetical protein PIB30_105160 [Stylosanthes scabra]|uniref:Uncharacterized protein n=1 Tax=Stylosanthes scabra TaxID=79078 RepID=A0ABU6RYJ1_9FABA|nr:hypothetical protein [Stylosanthes scabra]
MGFLVAIPIWKVRIRSSKGTSNLTKTCLRQMVVSIRFIDGLSRKVREWFKNNPKNLKISDPETASFLNQKSQIQAALTGSQSKKSIKGKLKQILHLLQEDEVLSPNEESDQENEDNPNEDDCFGVNLDDD